MSKKRNVFLQFSFLIVCCLIPITSMAATFTVGTGGQYDALDNAFAAAGNSDIIVLLSDINSTLTHGNTTGITKSITFTSQGHTVFLNNTLFFNGTGTTVTFSDSPTFVRQSAGDTLFSNNSLIQLTDSTTLTGSSATLTAGGAGSAVNISGNGNTIANGWTITGTGGGVNSMAFNLSGSGNNISITSGTITSEGKGINLVGSSNQITVSSTSITAPSGKIYIHGTATGNTISDTSFSANLPTVYIYNGTSVKTTSSWYFYNDSWSPSGLNRNITIDISHKIPLAGNAGISANFYNVSGSLSDIHRNISLDLSNGYSGGLMFNFTKDIKFFKFPAEVPVNISFGDNTFGGSYQELKIGTVVVLNFNPVNSLPSENFNVTQTTNWSTITDFTAAPNVRFVVEDGTAAHVLRGNLSFTENLDLTDPATGAGLSNLGSNLNMATAGNSIDLNVAAAGMSAFNKTAILTVYPTGFNFTTGSDVKITATTDAGASTVLYNKGVWLNKAGFVAAGDNVTVGSGWILLPVQHFSRYDFDQGTSDSGGGSVTGGSDDSSSAAGVSGTETTSIVNVGGGSAITRVEVIGTNLGKNLVVTAIPSSGLPSSLSAPSTTVYQYMFVTTSTIPGSLREAILEFSIPMSWITGHGFTIRDIVMLHNVDGQWQTLETHFVSQTADTVNYRAITPSFSYFAVAYQQDGTNMTVLIPASTPSAIMTEAPASESLTKSVLPVTVGTTGTEALPLAEESFPSSGIPLIIIAIGIIGVVVLIIVAFIIRRWWIRRQNPALFREL